MVEVDGEAPEQEVQARVDLPRLQAAQLIVHPADSQSMNQPINQASKQAINQPINQSTNQPINKSANQAFNVHFCSSCWIKKYVCF